jgi:cation transport regulator ChaB
MPAGKKRDIPSTIERSDEHAQEIYIKAHDSAVESYGEGERAHRTAYAALKHSYKKEGDHWVAKEHKGPSDPQAAQGYGDKPKRTGGGKEVPLEEWPKDSLYQRAKQLDISGRGHMKKSELIAAIKRSS